MTDTWQDVPARTAPVSGAPVAPVDDWQDVPAPEPAFGTQGISDRLSKGWQPAGVQSYVLRKLPDIASDTAEFFKEGVHQTVSAITGNGPSQLEDLRPEVERQLISVGRTPEIAKLETEQLMRSWRRQERMGGAIMGPLTALTAPILGAYRSLFSRPLEEVGGPPKEVTEMAGMVAGTVAGLPAMSRQMARVKVTPDGKVTAQAVGDLPKDADFKMAAELLTTEPPMEKIVGAAIRTDKGIFQATTHSMAAAIAEDKGIDLSNLSPADIDGFVTSTGRYVSREEAAKIADAFGQTRDPGAARLESSVVHYGKGDLEVVTKEEAMQRRSDLPAARFDAPFYVVDREKKTLMGFYDRAEAESAAGLDLPAPSNPAIVEQNLRTLWDERGIHPAEALDDARSDAFLKHELTQPEPPAPEKVATAAIRVEGKTFTGFAHADAVIAAEDAMGLEPGALTKEGAKPVESGFLTTTGRFVDRHEANRIVGFADEAGGLDAWNLPELHDQVGLARVPHPDRPLGKALQAVDELRAANRGLPNEDRAILGELISAVRGAAAKRQLSVEDGVVQQGDRFKKAPLSETAPNDPVNVVETAWLEADQDLARAQTALARIDEVKARHPELAGQIDRAVQAVEDTLAQRDQMRPKSLGADVTRDPSLVPLTEQPPPPAGSLMASAQEGARTLFDIGRDIQMKVAPIATGTRESILIAKDFANTMRKNRWEWARIHDYLTKTFSPEQWKRMWDAADEESVLRQEMAAGGPSGPDMWTNPASGQQFTRQQAEGMLTMSKKNFQDIEVTVKDPIERKRNPAMVAHLESQVPGLRQMIDSIEAFLAQKPGPSRTGAAEHMGLATLEPAERAIVEGLHARAENAWLRARDIGLVEGEGLPAYTPRMVVNAAGAIAEQGALPLNSMGTNLKASTARLMKRKYLTAEETEAAAKEKTRFAEALKAKSVDEIEAAAAKVELVRDIRTLPLAIAQLEDAIAGRTLVNEIKKAGKAGGSDTVAEGAVPTGSEQKWFTIDHPALKTWRPKFKEVDGKLQAVKDAQGETVFEQVPIYIRGDFEGPLRAVLETPSGATYRTLMDLKGKTMSVIMYSPAIHNLVEFGRAFPAMPTRIFKAYFDGNRAKNDVAIMTEAIDSGLVPIGKRFFKQDLDAIMESPDLTPGRSWTAKIAAAVPGLFDEAAGTAVKRTVDKMGDFWHNTLLWDRIGDLQMGLYTNLRGDLIGKGVDAKTASIVAAHWANRYAGALPQEAMSAAARKTANMVLFSRSFTMGNLGVMKDMLTGLPKDVLAMIEREGGFKEGSLSSEIPQIGEFSKGMAMRKAMAVVMLDIALMYVGNSVLQSTFNVMLGDKTIDEETHGYTRRMKEVLNRVETHPMSLLQPFELAERLSATGENEPGRRDRIRIGYQSDGTAIYARNPVGKIGEEFIGYMANPLEMLKRKEGTVARPLLQIFQNDKGFGRKVYDPNAETPMDKAAAIWAMVEHFAKAQTPEGSLNALSDLVKGEGDPKTSTLQLFGPLAGVTFSRGAPGGPAVGELYDFRQRHDVKVNMALPDIRKQILRGDLGGAMQRMRELDIPPQLQRFYIRTTLDPSTRVGGRTLRDFYLSATPEQRERLERARQ